MSRFEEILSKHSDSETQWHTICEYAKELNQKCKQRLSAFTLDETMQSAVKKLLTYATRLETERKIELYQHMDSCIEYFDKNAIRFWLKNAETMEYLDYEALKSVLNNKILEERHQEEKRISDITYTKNDITAEIFKAFGMNYKMDSAWSDYCWTLLCEFVHTAFNMDMSEYKNGKSYSVSVYDAAVLISYGVLLKNDKHNTDVFLNKIKNKDYAAVKLTEWKIFWNLVFKTLKGLLSEYIKDDKKEYGVCHHNKLLCKDCPELFYCNHMSSITRTVQSTENTVNELLNIRDGANKIYAALTEKIKKYSSFLHEKVQLAAEDKRELLVQAYLYTLSEYITAVIQSIQFTAMKNENYGFLLFSDFEIDVQSENIIVSFSPPRLNPDWNKTEMNSQELLEYILDSLTDYFNQIKTKCYLCMAICPSKSPLSISIQQSQMLSQEALLFQKSIDNALSLLEKWFKKEIKNYP